MPRESMNKLLSLRKVDVRKVQAKRRQLVSCDSCRLRRVRCIRNGDSTSCEECDRKGVRCTSNYLEVKPRIIRSGKRIQQAKVLFGDVDAGNCPTPHDHSFIHEGAPVSFHAPQTQLVNSTLARNITIQLIEVYRTVVHPFFPYLQLDSFMYHYESRHCDTSLLPPHLECLALVMQAWAARFSDHPAVVGPKATGATKDKAAKIVASREAFATAMVNRALRAIDDKGVMRTASSDSVRALVMMEMLHCWGEFDRRKGRFLLSTAVEHVKFLQESPNSTLGQQRISEVEDGHLFWIVWQRDSQSAALSGWNPMISEDDVLLGCPCIHHLRRQVPDMDRAFAADTEVGSFELFRTLQSHLADVTRFCAVQIGGPIARRHLIDEDSLQEVWAKLALNSARTSIFKEGLEASSKIDPLTIRQWTRELRSAQLQLAFSIHQRLTARVNDLETSALSQGESDTLLQLYDESHSHLLAACRRMSRVLESYNGSRRTKMGMIFELLPSMADFMLSMPATEEGGAFDNWALTQKVDEISPVLEALENLGRCRLGLQIHIQHVTECLASMRDTIHRLGLSPPSQLFPISPPSTPLPPPTQPHFPPPTQSPQPSATVPSPPPSFAPLTFAPIDEGLESTSHEHNPNDLPPLPLYYPTQSYELTNPEDRRYSMAISDSSIASYDTTSTTVVEPWTDVAPVWQPVESLQNYQLTPDFSTYPPSSLQGEEMTMINAVIADDQLEQSLYHPASNYQCFF